MQKYFSSPSSLRKRLSSRLVINIAFIFLFVYFCHIAYASIFNLNRVYGHDSYAIAINTQCINEFGTDQYGNSYPLISFSTSPTLYAYTLSLVYRLFPNSIETMQLYSLFLGFFFISILYLYLNKVLDKQFAKLFIPAFIVISFFSPWISSVLTIPFEFTLCPLLVILTIWSTKNIFEDPGSIFHGICFGLIMGLLPYAHWGTKFLFIVNLIFIPGILIFFERQGVAKFVKSKGLLLGFLLCFIMASPHLVDFLFSGEGMSRSNALAERNILHIIVNYFSFFNAKFVFFGPNKISNAYSGYGGALNILLFPLFIAGFFLMLYKSFVKKDKLSFYYLVGLFTGFLPAGLVQSQYYAGNIIRIIAVVPFILIICAYGAQIIFNYFLFYTNKSFAHVFVCLFIILGSLLSLKNAYLTGLYPANYTPIPAEWADSRQIYPCDDHSIESARYRYYRLFFLNDLSYCGCVGKEAN